MVALKMKVPRKNCTCTVQVRMRIFFITMQSWLSVSNGTRNGVHRLCPTRTAKDDAGGTSSSKASYRAYKCNVMPSCTEGGKGAQCRSTLAQR